MCNPRDVFYQDYMCDTIALTTSEMPIRCFVFDLDDVLLPTTSLFQRPSVYRTLQQMPNRSLQTVMQTYQTFIHPDMHLIQCLHQLHGPKYLITNASRNHASASINALCITQYLQGQLDADCNMPLKPHKHMYQAMQDHITQSIPNQPLQIVFFDDKIENLIEPRLLNWVTVWICGTHDIGNRTIPSFINYVFRTVHEALLFFRQHQR